MKDLDMTKERDIIGEAQKELAAAKRAVRGFRGLMGDLMTINREEGRLEAENAAMGVRGDASCILGDLDRMHCEATKAMREHFPEFADEIQTRGPGGGR